MNIGKSLKIALTLKDIKNKELAAKMGVSSAYVSGIATGVKTPSLAYLSNLSSVLGYSVSEFIALGEEEKAA